MLLESESYRAFLADELSRRIRANPQYSQRAFARQLSMSPGELSEILRGKRKLSFNSVLRIAKSLGLNAEETRHLGYLVQVEKSKEMGTEDLLKSALTDDRRNQLSVDLFNLISDWYCFAIVNLAETEGFRWNLNWIARRLNISVPQARVAVERLERVGVIEKVNGRLRIAKDFVLSPDGIPSEAVRNYHRQIINKSLHAIDNQSMDEREIRGLTIAIDPKQLPAMKKELSAFLEKFVERFSKGKNVSEVYQLELTYFKLTHGGIDNADAE